MIDLHCHILPFIDDGPDSINDSLMMLKQAVEEGIDTIVVTPHRNNIYQPSLKKIEDSRDMLQEVIIQNDLPISLVLGQEVHIYGDLLKDYLNGRLFSVNKNSRYILVEFETFDIPKYAERLFYDMECEGIVPIIVHPERNKKILENPDVLYRFIANGALSQVTASSLTGTFGRTIKKFSFQLFENNLAHFVAGDAHDTKFRNFRMKNAFKMLEKKYGIDYINNLHSNSKKILLNEPLSIDAPKKIPRKHILGFITL